MYTKLDIKQWNRHELFHFFNSFEEPFFGITAQVDVTSAYKKSKEHQTLLPSQIPPCSESTETI